MCDVTGNKLILKKSNWSLIFFIITTNQKIIAGLKQYLSCAMCDLPALIIIIIISSNMAVCLRLPTLLYHSVWNWPCVPSLLLICKTSCAADARLPFFFQCHRCVYQLYFQLVIHMISQSAVESSSLCHIVSHFSYILICHAVYFLWAFCNKSAGHWKKKITFYH